MKSAMDVHKTRSLKGIFRPGAETSGRRNITGLTRSRNLIFRKSIVKEVYISGSNFPTPRQNRDFLLFGVYLATDLLEISINESGE
jgi:hypothetical protein